MRRQEGSIPWHERCDRGELLNSHQRADGTLLLEGYAAREGVLEYRRADGSVFREFVSADTLRESAAGLARAPVTLEHPEEPVSPDNVADLGVGDVDGEVFVEDGGFVRVRMAVRRRDAITAVKDRKKGELSPGYAVRLDPTPGVHPVYGRYDAIQVERRYNHLAIVQRARGGKDIRVRADSAVATTSIRADAASPATSPATQRGTMNARLVTLLTLLGVTQRVDSDDAAIDAAIDALNKRKDAEDKASTAAVEASAKLATDRDNQKARADKAESERDALKARADSAEAEVAKLRTAEASRKDADERAKLVVLAEQFQVDAKAHPKNSDLKRAIAAAHLGSELKADATDAYVDAVIDLASQAGRSDGVEAGGQAWAPRGDAAGASGTKRRLSPAQAARARYDDDFNKSRKGGDR